VLRNIEAPQERRANRRKDKDSIARISLVVNSLDKPHFEAALRELFTVSKKVKLPIGSVIHIGDYRAVTKTAEEELKRLGGSFSAATEPPREYGITSSPTWILFTPDSTIVLEVVRSVGRYITPNGEFIENPLVEDRPPEIDIRGGF